MKKKNICLPFVRFLDTTYEPVSVYLEILLLIFTFRYKIRVKLNRPTLSGEQNCVSFEGTIDYVTDHRNFIVFFSRRKYEKFQTLSILSLNVILRQSLDNYAEEETSFPAISYVKTIITIKKLILTLLFIRCKGCRYRGCSCGKLTVSNGNEK